MTALRPTIDTELPLFASFERQSHAREFINATSLEEHCHNFSNPDFIYLTIENDAADVVGYFILVKEANNRVEFRRIVIDENQRGIGQSAIIAMEEYCNRELRCESIWLDVYDDNVVGRHIYEKFGYLQFKSTVVSGRILLFYEKLIG